MFFIYILKRRFVFIRIIKLTVDITNEKNQTIRKEKDYQVNQILPLGFF